MTNLGHYLSIFLREYLPCERGASQHTCDTYAYGFQLLVYFAARRAKKQPSQLTIEYLDAPLIRGPAEDNGIRLVRCFCLLPFLSPFFVWFIRTSWKRSARSDLLTYI